MKRLEVLDVCGGHLKFLPVELGALTLAHTLRFRELMYDDLIVQKATTPSWGTCLLNWVC